MTQVRFATVIGCGVMGAGIASILARAGFEVRLLDAREELEHAGLVRVHELLDDGVRRGKLDPTQASEARSRVSVAAGVHGREPALVIEAVPERLELKRRVIAAAEESEPWLLASNTSAISIAELAAGLRRPDRFVGLHFFNPVPAMALVEIVVGPQTSELTREAARELVEQLGKQAIVVADAPGFATSRLGVALGLEAIRTLEDGVASAADIDRAMQLGYGHPIGPLRLTDLVGLDVRLDIAHTLERAYGPRFAPPALLERMVAEGRLGRKSGAGFYAYADASDG